VKHFAQQDPIVQQRPKNFLAVVGIILLQHLITSKFFLVYLLCFLHIFEDFYNKLLHVYSLIVIFVTFSDEISGITAGRVPHLRKVRYM
jgi:hypothetical protein